VITVVDLRESAAYDDTTGAHSPQKAMHSSNLQESPAVAPLNPLTDAGLKVPLRIAGHDLVLFMEAPPLIDAMVRDISAAQKRVWLETYIFMDDAAGQAVAAALISRAAAGVDVRVIYDAVGSFSTPSGFFKLMEDSGVKVYAFRPLSQLLSQSIVFSAFNRRDHRKLLIIDDEIGYFGGMNIVDQREMQTVDDVKAKHLPTSAGWRDLHVRLVGPQQEELAASFDRLWRGLHRQRRQPSPPWPVQRMLTTPEETISFFDSRPSLKYRRPQRVFAPLLRRARRRIIMSMAYFIPVGQVLREIVHARRRGVEVVVIVPGQSDVKLVQWASRHFYSYLLKLGVQIYERENQMLHSKVMVIDDEWTIAGSCNLDPRSLRLNLEFLAVFRSRVMAAAVEEICMFEMQNSRRVTQQDCEQRTWRQRILDYTCWSFRHWL